MLDGDERDFLSSICAPENVGCWIAQKQHAVDYKWGNDNVQPLENSFKWSLNRKQK